MPEPVLPEVEDSPPQAEPSPQPAQEARSKSSALTLVLLLLITLLVFCLIAVAIAAVLYFQFRPAPETNSGQAQTTVSTPSHEIERARQAEAMDAANFRADELAVVRERISAQLHAANNVQQNIETFRREISTWQDAVLPLMTNDQGKAVAADPRALQDFLALYQEELPPPDLLDAFETRLQPLVDHLQTAGDVQDARLYRPTEEFVKSIDTLAADVREAINAYRRHNRLLAALLLRAPKPETLPTEALTLEAAMSKLEQDRKIEDLQFVSHELESLRQQNREKIRDAIAEKETKIADAQAEAEKKLGELESQKIITAVDEQLATFKQEQEQREREAKFQAALPEIRAYLTPFFVQALSQPSASGPVMANEKAPVSWRALQASGALEDTTDSLGILFRVIASAPDRATYGWPRGMTQEGVSFCLKAKQLLKEFGPQLVEKKMLVQ